MVGNEHVGALAVQQVKTARRQRRTSLGKQPLQERRHNLELELALAVQRQQHMLKLRILVVGEQHAHNLLKHGFLNKNGHLVVEILVSNGANVAILHRHFHVLVFHSSRFYVFNYSFVTKLLILFHSTKWPHQSFTQKVRVKRMSTVKSSRRPTSISIASNHFAGAGSSASEPKSAVTP